MKKTTTILCMQRVFIFALACCAALLTSCSSEDGFGSNNGNGNGDATNSLIVEATPKTMHGFTTSRSKLSFTSEGMAFTWTGDDKLTVWESTNSSEKMTYNLTSGAGEPRAKFQATSFNLLKDHFYISLSKEGDVTHATINSPSNITLNYAGQVQTGNANYNHLGNYDYMVAGALCLQDNLTSFQYDHLGVTLRLWMWPENSSDYEDFKATEFTDLEIYDSENGYRKPQRYFSFDAGLSGGTYRPIWPEQNIQASDPRFTMKLESSINSGHGIKPTEKFDDESYNNDTDPSGNLLLYIEVPPVDLRGKTLGFIIKGKKGEENKTYYATVAGENILAGNAYQYNLKLKKPTEYKVTLKINHMWQHGDPELTPTSKATGDPGYDKEYGLPAHVYYIFCVDNKVRAVKHQGEGTEKAVNHFNTSTTDWTTDKSAPERIISTLSNDYLLTLSVPETEAGVPKRLYVIASKEAIPDSKFSGIANGDDESEVQALTYDLDGTYGVFGDKQIFMRDLYSTPWQSNVTFVGNLTDPEQDVFLYHTAAKVDLKWNSTEAMTPSTHNISVTGVKSTGLSMFQPTTNSGFGSYSESTTITPGTMYNGRQVYYLPQFSNNQYNVTIGEKNYSNYQFNEVSTDGGFTSWYRALIKQ